MTGNTPMSCRSAYDRVPRDMARYGLGEWDRSLGNHRAVIRVEQVGEAVYAWLPWRRRDAFPQAKHVMIVEARTGKVVENCVVATCNREYGEVVFQPTSGPGLYYAYYLIPSQDRHRWIWPRSSFPVTLYGPPRTTASPAWCERHRLRPEDTGSTPDPRSTSWQSSESFPAPWRDLPEAELVEFQSRGEWHSFYPMEVIATLEERLQLERRCGDRPFLLFPESRFRPIRMTRDIPRHWAVRDPEALQRFGDTAQKNEYYVFQIGLHAHRDTVVNVKAHWTALDGPGGAAIPAAAIACLNLAGVDQRGKSLRKRVHVASGSVQALWFGVDIPPETAPGLYAGTVTITAQDAEPQTVDLHLTVEDRVLADRGDGDGARLSRLRWLDSTHAVDDRVCAPYTPVRVRGRLVQILGRALELGEDGLPAQLTSFIDMFCIRATGRDILAGPVRFETMCDGTALTWQTTRPARCSRKASGKAVFRAVHTAPGLTRQTETTVEMDGRIGVRVTLRAEAARQLDDVRLRIRMPAAVSRYCLESAPPSWTAAGPSRMAFDCPAAMRKPLTEFLFAWFGDYNAGLTCSIARSQADWLQGGEGIFRQSLSADTCAVDLATGPVSLPAGKPVTFEVAFYVTPFKPLPAEHWDWRYCHQGYGKDLDLEQGLRAGATVFIQHQGSPNCPYINYLFPVADTLKRLADAVHAAGGRFKAYNTIREQSTRTSELWALRSLGHEILPACSGKLGFETMAQLPLEYQLRDQVNEPFTGQLWMCEHLVDDYHARWHSSITAPDGRMLTEDSSLQISGASRWANFYIESQRWLMEHAGVDGLYLDGVTFDREAFLRVRKTLVRQKPEALIDWHGAPGEIMDFLGFVDSLWFGEGADYSREDAYWLVAVSGIPFGIPGELLQADASVHRGMVYGLSQRYAWMPLDRVNPASLWRWWDAFDIKQADMLGYWMPECPVRTGNAAVKATAYVHPGRRLAIAVASWAKEPVDVRLEIDWQAVGLDPDAVRISVPEIGMFQPALSAPSLEALPVEPGKGWIVEVATLAPPRWSERPSG